jgi:hypothetical protein
MKTTFTSNEYLNSMKKSVATITFLYFPELRAEEFSVKDIFVVKESKFYATRGVPHQKQYTHSDSSHKEILAFRHICLLENLSKLQPLTLRHQECDV